MFPISWVVIYSFSFLCIIFILLYLSYMVEEGSELLEKFEGKGDKIWLW